MFIISFMNFISSVIKRTRVTNSHIIPSIRYHVGIVLSGTNIEPLSQTTGTIFSFVMQVIESGFEINFEILGLNAVVIVV